MNDLNFAQWWDSCYPEIGMVKNILSVRLSDDPEKLMSQLTEIEAWHGTVTSMKAEATSYLSKEENCVLFDRSDEWTDLDRRAHQKFKTAEQKKAVDVLDGLADSIKTRLMLGMALMKAQCGERVGGRVLS